MEIEVAPLSDLGPGSVTVVEVGGAAVAVFNTGEGLYAVDNRCAHRGGPISRGWVSDGVVTCPWHWWRYRLSTGQRLGSDRIGLKTYPVSVRDDMVVVEAPDVPERPTSIREMLLEHAQHWNREG